MTQRTKAELATQIATLLADNTSGDISESDVRSVFTDTKDSLVGGPASATDNVLIRFDGTTGQLIQSAGIVVADTTFNTSNIGMITLNDDAGLQTTTTTTDKYTIGAYDVDGTAYKVFATLTAADVPLCAFTQPAGTTLTWDGGAIGSVTPATGAFTTLGTTGTVIFNTASADLDFTVKKLTAGNAIVYDAGADTLTLGGALTHDGGAIFNEAGAAVNFRVESDTNANALFVDGTNNRVGILNAAPSVALDVTGAILASTTITSGTALASTTTNTAGTYFLRSVGNALTAAGTTRADALQLAKEINNVTTAAAGTGVILPVGVVGMRITVFNAGANAIQVYASASETIDAVAGATGVPLTNAKRADYFFTAADTWISAQLGVVSA